MRKLLAIFTTLILLGGCKKIIDIDTKNAPPKIVIEGKINDIQQDQIIKISKTVNYDADNNFPPVSGATVTVVDGSGNNFIFAEISPGIYMNNMRGTSGEIYNLTVQVEGNTYTASSKMPNVVKLDSIGIVSNSFFGNTRRSAAAYFVDPQSETNYYRFTLTKNDLRSTRVYVNNDRLTNGNSQRIQLFFNTNNDENENLESGDKIKVEMEDIDSHIFDYWFAISQQTDRGPNQGTTPANPPSNLSNGALGYFSANTFQSITATVK